MKIQHVFCCFISAFFLFLASDSSHAEDINTNGFFGVFYLDEAISNEIIFQGCLDKSSLSQSATGFLACKISNQSTNFIFYSRQTMTAYLTNQSGENFIIIQPPKQPPVSMGDLRVKAPAISFDKIAPKDSAEWKAPILINRMVTPGKYCLVATEIVVKKETQSACYIHLNIALEITPPKEDNIGANHSHGTNPAGK